MAVQMGRNHRKVNRRTFLKLFGAGTISSGLTALGGYQYVTAIEPSWLDVERVTIPLGHLPSALEGFKIVVLSDFHLYPFTRIDLVRKAVSIANGLKPDLIALLGDYVLERADAIFELAPVLAQLDARYGLFAILGNHDYWTDVRTVRAGLRKAGLPLLTNEGITLSVGQESIYLAGLDDGWSGQPDMQAALDGLPSGLASILLMHEPDFADTFALDRRNALQLSGHSHGGQVRVPGVGALILPRFARKYDAGLYKVRDMWLYTTRGIGVVGLPVRFRCRPEVTELTLVGGN